MICEVQYSPKDLLLLMKNFVTESGVLDLPWHPGRHSITVAWLAGDQLLQFMEQRRVLQNWDILERMAICLTHEVHQEIALPYHTSKK